MPLEYCVDVGNAFVDRGGDIGLGVVEGETGRDQGAADSDDGLPAFTDLCFPGAEFHLSYPESVLSLSTKSHSSQYAPTILKCSLHLLHQVVVINSPDGVLAVNVVA